MSSFKIRLFNYYYIPPSGRYDGKAFIRQFAEDKR